MTWEREIEAMTVEDLVTRNSPHLLAHQLKSECRRYRELVVRDAARAGRKTVRIADLSPQLIAPQQQ